MKIHAQDGRTAAVQAFGMHAPSKEDAVAIADRVLYELTSPGVEDLSSFPPLHPG